MQRRISSCRVNLREELQRAGASQVDNKPTEYHQMSLICSEIVKSGSNKSNHISAYHLSPSKMAPIRMLSDNFGEIQAYKGLHKCNEYVDGTDFNINLTQIQVCRNKNGRKIVLGQGGFATVYKGIFQEKSVAIKYLNPQYQGTISQEDQEALQNELDALCKVDTPYIVKCYGGQTAAGSRALVMEYINHGTLKDYINAHKDHEIQLNRIYYFAKSIAKALVILHPDAIHCDVKPTNILLNKEGQVKLSDFGFCMFMDTSYVYSQRCCGTFHYLAPEVFISGKLHWSVDIYALGITIWELYHREQAWSGYQDLQVVVKVGEQGERPPINSNCPKELSQLIKWCWNQNPKLRPSAQQVVHYCNQQIKQIKQMQ